MSGIDVLRSISFIQRHIAGNMTIIRSQPLLATVTLQSLCQLGAYRLLFWCQRLSIQRVHSACSNEHCVLQACSCLRTWEVSVVLCQPNNGLAAIKQRLKCPGCNCAKTHSCLCTRDLHHDWYGARDVYPQTQSGGPLHSWTGCKNPDWP